MIKFYRIVCSLIVVATLAFFAILIGWQAAIRQQASLEERPVAARQQKRQPPAFRLRYQLIPIVDSHDKVVGYDTMAYRDSCYNGPASNINNIDIHRLLPIGSSMSGWRTGPVKFKIRFRRPPANVLLPPTFGGFEPLAAPEYESMRAQNTDSEDMPNTGR
jgi:hypothetical protein